MKSLGSAAGARWGGLYPFQFALLVAVISSPAWASVPLLDPAIGHGVDAILDLASKSGLEFAHPWKRVAERRDPASYTRLRRAFERISRFGGVELRYDDVSLALIEGTPQEPNAFSTGPTVYVSKGMLTELNDRELTAVLAHELAHAEEGHLTERMSFAFSAVLVQLGRTIASDVASIARGDADGFMQELWRKGHWAMMMEMIESATLGQELQADCIAYRWLENMRRFGLAHSGRDIASALSTLVGVSESVLIQHDPVLGARVRQIRTGAYARRTCD